MTTGRPFCIQSLDATLFPRKPELIKSLMIVWLTGAYKYYNNKTLKNQVKIIMEDNDTIHELFCAYSFPVVMTSKDSGA